MDLYCMRNSIALFTLFGIAAVQNVIAVCNVGFWGQNCDKHCGKCAGNGSCSNITGYCDNNCISGWIEPSCTKEISLLSPPLSPGLIGSIVALIGIVVIVAIVVAVLLIVRHMNKGRPLKKEIAKGTKDNRKSQCMETNIDKHRSFYESVPLEPLDTHAQEGPHKNTANRYSLEARESLDTNHHNEPDIFVLRTQHKPVQTHPGNIQVKANQNGFVNANSRETSWASVTPNAAANRKSGISVRSEDYALDLGAQFERAEYLIGVPPKHVLHL